MYQHTISDILLNEDHYGLNRKYKPMYFDFLRTEWRSHDANATINICSRHHVVTHMNNSPPTNEKTNARYLLFKRLQRYDDYVVSTFNFT